MTSLDKFVILFDDVLTVFVSLLILLKGIVVYGDDVLAEVLVDVLDAALLSVSNKIGKTKKI